MTQVLALQRLPEIVSSRVTLSINIACHDEFILQGDHPWDASVFSELLLDR